MTSCHVSCFWLQHRCSGMRQIYGAVSSSLMPSVQDEGAFGSTYTNGRFSNRPPEDIR